MTQGGQGQQQYDRSAQELERKIQRYLSGNEIKNIVTPGEYSEWPLTLKAGQVVIAEARSDAFDPALEVVDGKGEGRHKVLATNDDRYPGDQRPLLLWRCAKDGEYSLRARGFQGKAGGQVFVRMKVFETLDLVEGKTTEGAFEQGEPFLLRATLKRGSLVEVRSEPGDWPAYTTYNPEMTISPLGLPDAGLASPFVGPIGSPIVAPLDGDYYVLCRHYAGQRTKVRASLTDLTPKLLERTNGSANVPSTAGRPTTVALKVKKGEVLQVRGPELGLGGRISVAEEPDLGTVDPKKPELNPFFPKIVESSGRNRTPQEPAEALAMIPSRARDPREVKFAVLRDAVLWVTASRATERPQEASLAISPADAEYKSDADLLGRLGVGNVDYWSFEAKTGDVISLSARFEGFAPILELRDPNLEMPMRVEFAPDQASYEWNYVVMRPGKHLLSVSSVGGGGGGTYGLARKVLPAREFSMEQPAKGNFSLGVTEVWRCTFKANEAVLLRVWGLGRGVHLSVYNESGVATSLGLIEVDSQNRYAILKPGSATTLIFVFSKATSPTDYRVDVSSLAGGKPGGE